MDNVEDKTKKISSLSGTPLQQISETYYYSPHEKLYYYYNDDKMIPLKSSLTGGALKITEDGRLFSPYEKEYFSIKDGKVVSDEVKSPRTGAKMEKISENFYYDPYEKMTFLENSGEYIPLISSFTGGALEITEDGRLFSPYEKGYFTIDMNRGKTMPLFMPDDTMEPAYYEDDCLVGVETNRKYPINEFGGIDVPFIPVVEGEDWNARIERIRNMSQDEINFNLDMKRNHPEYFTSGYICTELNGKHSK
ncbi:MAG: hypothetical protein ACI4OG_03200 [Bacilli bacterium]